MCLGVDEYWCWLLQEKNNPRNFLAQKDVDPSLFRWGNSVIKAYPYESFRQTVIEADLVTTSNQQRLVKNSSMAYKLIRTEFEVQSAVRC